METIKVQRDNMPDLSFTGELIASVSSSANNASGSYSGNVGRWTELYLYRTKSGKYVCQSIGCTQWQGEHARYSAEVCNEPSEVCEFFGSSWLAKELFEAADLDCSERVD